MKRLLVIYQLYCLLVLLPLYACSKTPMTKQNGIENKVKSAVPLADPFILLDGDTYYAYGTHSDEGIEVYKSNDLNTWEYVGLALQKQNSWGDRWFWAPEVYQMNGKYYMYYSADEHLCVAMADAPTGPFIQPEKQPMLEDKNIDNSLFIDDDGTPYMTFVNLQGGNHICIAQLTSDLLSVRKETIRPILSMSQEWEKVWPTVNEAPFIIKHNGVYFLTYSANSYESPLYGVGCATATQPLGQWTKYDENPLLQKPGNLVGVGHSAMFLDKTGALRIVFHAHKENGIIHPRMMYIGDVKFVEDNGIERMRIDNNYIIPQLNK